MTDREPKSGGQTRRTFLERAAAGAATVGGSAALSRSALAATRASSAPRGGMNILVVMVDQMRLPSMWLPSALRRRALPNITRLADRSVQFVNHVTASNACSPARSTILTGLYTHQNAMYITQELQEGGALGGNSPDLNPGFPTYGTMLRSIGYKTAWIGKWHLSSKCDYEPYGFATYVCPSPNGGPGEGLQKDPTITEAFLGWLEAHGSDGPWCTTVSFVNPHDIAFYPRFTRVVPIERNPSPVFRRLPANYETPRRLIEQRKPFSQRGLQQAEGVAIGAMPYQGEAAVHAWTKLLDTYLLMHQLVDRQVGRVLDALAARPQIARNTIVLFLADHGEYGGAHGQRGKAAMAYEEAIRVPLTAYDPSGTWTKAIGSPRHQLTSSVDFAPLLLTMASGGEQWRTDPRWEHIASRLKMEDLLASPTAHGRPYVIHATDERAVEEGPTALLAARAPTHVIGVRDAHGKYVSYNYWPTGTVDIQAKGAQTEAYDYATRSGRLELDNERRKPRSQQPPFVRRLQALWAERAIPDELRQPLPAALQPVQQQALADYLAYVQEPAS